jgi:GT2 family glycosyltransferase
MPDISVVIPTCDRGPLLERAVASVLAQTRRPTQVIVVDNGEEPTTAQLDDAAVAILRTAPRIGPSRPRNIGAEHATTSLVAFLDDDDLWLPHFLEHTLAAFAADPTAAAVVGRVERRRADGTQSPYKQFPAEPEAQRAVYYRNPGFAGSYITLKRDILLGMGGFDTRMPASVDRDLAARLLQRGERISVAPNAVAVVCDHEGARVRGNQVRGNRMFLLKHWPAMRWDERWKASRTLARRWYRYSIGGRTVR